MSEGRRCLDTPQFAPTVNTPWTDLPAASPMPLSRIGQKSLLPGEGGGVNVGEALMVEVEIDQGRIVAREPEKLPAKGAGLLTFLPAAGSTDMPARPFGLARGEFVVPADFNAPLPDQDHALGKLPLPQPPGNYIPAQPATHGIQSLSLDESAVRRLAGLPPHHRDPFDRMLVWQALESGLYLASSDPVMRQYGVALI